MRGGIAASLGGGGLGRLSVFASMSARGRRRFQRNEARKRTPERVRSGGLDQTPASAKPDHCPPVARRRAEPQQDARELSPEVGGRSEERRVGKECRSR